MGPVQTDNFSIQLVQFNVCQKKFKYHTFEGFHKWRKTAVGFCIKLIKKTFAIYSAFSFKVSVISGGKEVEKFFCK